MSDENQAPAVNRDDLRGTRVLVVEDEMLVAMMIEDMLEEFGCTVVGPASRVAAAFDLIETEEIDGAVLDVNLGGERVFPVAEALRTRRIPFVFATGYNVNGLQPDFADSPAIQKPFRSDQFRRVLTSALLI